MIKVARKRKMEKHDDLLLFQEVKCGGFIAKIRNIHNSIEFDEATNTYTVREGKTVKEGLTEASIIRNYYDVRETAFTGVYVGTKPVVIQAKVESWIDNSGVTHYCKHPLKVEDCGIVYFAPNRKHLVPLRYLNIR